MPFGDGTGPRGGGGPGTGRGMGEAGIGRVAGRGRTGGGARIGAGPGGGCVCSACGVTVPHQAGLPCSEVKCPKCRTPMARA